MAVCLEQLGPDYLRLVAELCGYCWPNSWGPAKGGLCLQHTLLVQDMQHAVLCQVHHPSPVGMATRATGSEATACMVQPLPVADFARVPALHCSV
jgi:hypothetical protein